MPAFAEARTTQSFAVYAWRRRYRTVFLPSYAVYFVLLTSFVPSLSWSSNLKILALDFPEPFLHLPGQEEVHSCQKNKHPWSSPAFEQFLIAHEFDINILRGVNMWCTFNERLSLCHLLSMSVYVSFVPCEELKKKKKLKFFFFTDLLQVKFPVAYKLSKSLIWHKLNFYLLSTVIPEFCFKPWASSPTSKFWNIETRHLYQSKASLFKTIYLLGFF